VLHLCLCFCAEPGGCLSTRAFAASGRDKYICRFFMHAEHALKILLRTLFFGHALYALKSQYLHIFLRVKINKE
jgi:hypothetical protein